VEEESINAPKATKAWRQDKNLIRNANQNKLADSMGKNPYKAQVSSEDEVDE
jgi:hypothetical protein